MVGEELVHNDIHDINKHLAIEGLLNIIQADDDSFVVLVAERNETPDDKEMFLRPVAWFSSNLVFSELFKELWFHLFKY